MLMGMRTYPSKGVLQGPWSRLLLLGSATWLWAVVSPMSSSALDITIARVRALMEEARAQRADVFGIGSFQSGQEALQRAIEDSAAGKKDERIQARLDDARRYFESALRTTERMKSSFPWLIAAFDSAQAKNAPVQAKEPFDKSMTILTRTIEKLEKGDLEEASKLAHQAAASFRLAEVESIKAEILGGIKDLLKKADDAGSRELAPNSYADVLSKLAKTEKYIEANPQDRETADRMATELGKDLSRTVYLATWISKLKASPNGWEQLIVQYSGDIEKICDTLRLKPGTDRDVAVSVETILAAIRSLQNDRQYLQQELAERDLKIGELEAEINKLASQSGKYMSELEVKRQQLQAQKRFEETVSRVTALLDSSEGTIFRSTSGSSDQIVIRLTGLKFKSGSAEIRPGDFGLLTRVQQVIREFPDRKIEIQGHTDSKGDERDNLKLSEARAEAVKDYLVTNMNLPADEIETFGFGESRPLASNDTAEGRILNRRIEIILEK